MNAKWTTGTAIGSVTMNPGCPTGTAIGNVTVVAGWRCAYPAYLFEGADPAP
jgi:hypothetical protein